MRSRTRLSIPQLAATALAAITMAVVSSRLSSFSSSILIAGLIAVVSAVSSEFYRILLDTGAEKTKEVVAPVLSEAGRHGSNDTEVSPAQADAARSQTQELPPTPVPHGETEGVEDEAETAANEDSLAQHVADTGDEGSPARPKRKVAAALLSALAHNQVAQMSLVFFLVALVTIGVSYGVARAQGGTHYNSFTTVTQSLSEEEKQSLLDEAAAQANANGDSGESHASTETGSTEPSTDNSTQPTETAQEPDEATGEADLADEVARLQQENESLQNSVDDLAAQLSTEQDTISDLLARLEALESQLAQQDSTPSTQTETGTPTP